MGCCNHDGLDLQLVVGGRKPRSVCVAATHPNRVGAMKRGGGGLSWLVPTMSGVFDRGNDRLRASNSKCTTDLEGPFRTTFEDPLSAGAEQSRQDSCPGGSCQHGGRAASETHCRAATLPLSEAALHARMRGLRGRAGGQPCGRLGMAAEAGRTLSALVFNLGSSPQNNGMGAAHPASGASKAPPPSSLPLSQPTTGLSLSG